MAAPSRTSPLKVAWFSYFPIEWLPDLPEELRALPRMHPATWQRVLIEEFQQDPGLEIHVLAVRSQFPRTMSFVRGNTTFHCLKVPKGLRAPSLFWVDTWAIRRALQRIKPDLIHAWGNENGAALVASRLPYPALVTVQGIMSWMTQLGVANSYQRFAARLEPRALRRATDATAESKFAVSYLGERYPELRLQQIEHSPSWTFHRMPRQPELEPLKFISVSTLGHAKGTDVLLQALEPLCARVKFKLLLVGGVDPQVRDAYQQQTSAELWSRIEFKNHLSSLQIAEELSRSALMIYPTRADTSPNAVKEAVVMGLPVVASAIGGILDYVIPGENGFLFPAGDVAGCRQAIESFLDHPTLSQGLIAPSVLTRSRDELSPATMARKFRARYLEIASRSDWRT